MRRRALLAAGGTALGAAFAGCLGGSRDTGHRATTTDAGTDDDPAGPTTTEFDGSLSVALERLQPAATVYGTDSLFVVHEDTQYLFYRVEVTDGEPPDRLDFGFRYGGDVFAPGVDRLWRARQTEDRYSADRGAGWLVFEVPAERTATHAALALGGEEWPVEEAVRERLSAPAPPLDLTWHAPREQPAGESEFGFEVTNDGDLDTWFVGALNAIGIRVAHAPATATERRIPADETVSWTVTHENGKTVDSATTTTTSTVDDGDGTGSDGTDDGGGDNLPDGRYALHWTGDTRYQPVTFVAPEDG